MQMDERTLYWFAGILEGEGSFMSGPPSEPNRPIIAVSMTDKDIIVRVSLLMGVTFFKNRQYRNGVDMGWKPTYMVHLRGKRAVEMMKELRPIMGQRRQAQIDKAIASYKPHPRFLSDDAVADIKRRLKAGEKGNVLARKYGVCHTSISKIKLRQRHPD